jgi:hypothetical protein
LANYKRLEDIVDEIVDEGEGAPLFAQRAKALLSKVAEIGTAGFLKALAADRQSDSTLDWLNEAQLVRKSHLYSFAMILEELRQEGALANAAGVSFQPSRKPVGVSAPGLAKLAEQLPAQFNACYLAMLAWLARMGAVKPAITTSCRFSAATRVAPVGGSRIIGHRKSTTIPQLRYLRWASHDWYRGHRSIPGDVHPLHR